MVTVAPIRVSAMGGDTVTVPHHEGITVGECLDQANITVHMDKGTSITANGDVVKPEERAEPGTVVVVARNVANG